MSINPPPNPNVNRFNNLYWLSADDCLTTGVADLRYLKFPNAQGTENLLATNITGTLTATGLVSLTNVNPPTSNATQPASTDATTKIPTTAWVQTAIVTGTSTAISTAVSTAGFQQGLIIQDKNYNYDAIAVVGQSSIFAGAYLGNCFAGSANNSVCGLTTSNGADVWLFLPVGTGGAPQVTFNSLTFAPTCLTFSADGNWGLLLSDNYGATSSQVYRWENNTFIITNAPNRQWTSACMSANGKYALLGITGGDKCRLSTNYGLDYLRVGESGTYEDVAMSATGKYMFIISYGVDGYISSDYGVTFTPVGIGAFSWYRCCISANGQYIIALANNAGLADRGYASNDFGATWVSIGADQIWIQTAMTDDGRFQVAWYFDGYYYSSNFGVSWIDSGGGSPLPRMSFEGRAKFSNQGKYITGNNGVNCNFSLFTELW